MTMKKNTPHRPAQLAGRSDFDVALAPAADKNILAVFVLFLGARR